MKLEPLISYTGILMSFYLSIILDWQNFFHWYILKSWKLKRPQIQLRPHHFWTYTSNLTTVVNSVLKFMINGRLQFWNHKFSKYVQQYTSFSCIWCLHLAIDSLCKGQYQLFWFPEASSSSEKQAIGPELSQDSPYSIS
jgi:hypothetical protein